MKSVFTSRKAKAMVDIAMILGLIIILRYSDPHAATLSHWRSSHCMLGTVWFALITVHAVQHWKFIRALTKKKVFLKNKLTAITTICFFLMAVSMLLFVIGFDFRLLRFHNVIGHLFGGIVIVHAVSKFKRFISLWGK